VGACFCSFPFGALALISRRSLIRSLSLLVPFRLRSSSRRALSRCISVQTTQPTSFVAILFSRSLDRLHPKLILVPLPPPSSPTFKPFHPSTHPPTSLSPPLPVLSHRIRSSSSPCLATKPSATRKMPNETRLRGGSMTARNPTSTIAKPVIPSLRLARSRPAAASRIVRRSTAVIRARRPARESSTSRSGTGRKEIWSACILRAALRTSTFFRFHLHSRQDEITDLYWI
jgi:hypothetical protein